MQLMSFLREELSAQRWKVCSFEIRVDICSLAVQYRLENANKTLSVIKTFFEKFKNHWKYSRKKQVCKTKISRRKQKHKKKFFPTKFKSKIKFFVDKTLKNSIQYMPYVFYPWTSIFRSLLLATAVTMNRTDSYARDNTYDKWHYEKMYNCVHLSVAVIRRHYDRFVFLWVKAGKSCSVISVSFDKVFTLDTRWICWWKKFSDVKTNEAVVYEGFCWYSHPHPLIFTVEFLMKINLTTIFRKTFYSPLSTLSVVVFSISVVKLANSCVVALYGNVKLTLSSINSTNCTYMWVHLNTSDVQPFLKSKKK
jgi:hypothetical protein